MEFKQLSEILKNPDFKFLKKDYLYFHHKSGYPLRKEMDFECYYSVTEVFENKLKAKFVISSLEEKDTEDKEFYFEDWNDKWWVTRLPTAFLATEIE